MKKLMSFGILVSILPIGSAFADLRDQQIYQDLGVTETQVQTSNGVIEWTKSAGGITCNIVMVSQTQSTTYTCALPPQGPSGLDAEALYKSIIGYGRAYPTAYGTLMWGKTAGWIDCKKIITFKGAYTAPVTTAYTCMISKSLR